MAFSPIPLAKTPESYPSQPSPVSAMSDTSGLSLFIDNPRVVDLPEQGCITFRFTRGPLTIRESGANRPGSASADLTLTEICEVTEEDAPEGIESKDVVDDLFEKLRGEEDSKDEGEGAE